MTMPRAASAARKRTRPSRPLRIPRAQAIPCHLIHVASTGTAEQSQDTSVPDQDRDAGNYQDMRLDLPRTCLNRPSFKRKFANKVWVSASSRKARLENKLKQPRVILMDNSHSLFQQCLAREATWPGIAFNPQEEPSSNRERVQQGLWSRRVTALVRDFRSFADSTKDASTLLQFDHLAPGSC